jgi:hypothetical protein
MATLNKYIYDIRGLLRNHTSVSSDYLTNRQIEFWIITQRASWIKKRDRLFIQQDHSLMQTLTSDVISIDRSFAPTTIPVSYRILRTKTVLPKLINFESWDGIISSGPVDMISDRFNHCEYMEAVNSGHGRFNKNQIFSFTLNKYLYIVSKGVSNYWQLLSQVGVIGIFEDPRELGNFTHVSGEVCWNEDMDYPISFELWDYMKGEIIKNNIDALVKIPVDLSNDDNQQKKDMP